MRLSPALAHALRDDPDDLAHLELAARLRAERDPRGEYIEQACALERAAIESPTRARLAAALASDATVRRLEDEDLRDLRLDRRRARHRRGFVSELELTVDELLDTKKNLDELAPITTLTVSASAPPRSPESPASRLAALLGEAPGDDDDDDGEEDPAALDEALAATRWLRALPTLVLRHDALGEPQERSRVAERIAAGDVLSNLRSLTLEGDLVRGRGFSTGDALTLVRAARAATSLSLVAQPLGPRFVRALAERGGVPVRHLRLEQAALGHEGVAALAAWQRSSPTLHTLAVRHDRVGDDALRALLVAVPTIEELSLRGLALGPTAAAVIVEAAPTLARLRALDLGWNELDGLSIEALVRAFVLARRADPTRPMVTLDLRGHDVHPSLALRVAQSVREGVVVRLFEGPFGADAWTDEPSLDDRLARIAEAGLFREGVPTGVASVDDALLDYFVDDRRGRERAHVEGFVEHDQEYLTGELATRLLAFAAPTIVVEPADEATTFVLRTSLTAQRCDRATIDDLVHAVNELLVGTDESRRLWPVGASDDARSYFVFLDVETAREAGLGQR